MICYSPFRTIAGSIATARRIGIWQDTAAIAMDTRIVTGNRSGWKVMDEPNTLTLTSWANPKPSMVPSTPPRPPRNIPSPKNSFRIDPSEAPSAFRRPISLRLSETTASIVVDTQIMVRRRTTTVTRNTRACSFPSTEASERVTRLTSRDVMPQGEYSRHMSALIQYINRHAMEPLTLDDLAGVFYSSKYGLMRDFKNYTGISIHQYLIIRRVLIAKELIQQGVKPKDASDRCGFSDYSSFYRAFKSRMGLSPEQFRREAIK